MYDINLPMLQADRQLLGPVAGNDYFKENRDRWFAEVISKLTFLGLEQSLWPQSAQLIDKLLYQCAAFEKLPRTMFIDCAFVADGIDIGEQDQRVAKRMEALSYVKNQFVCFTDGEDWWPNEKFFLVHDAETFLLYCKYEVARTDPSILSAGGTKRAKGRPRDEAAHTAREEKAARYQAWLSDCAAYRLQVGEKRSEYLHAKGVADAARQELHILEAQGAPKWLG